MGEHDYKCNGGFASCEGIPYITGIEGVWEIVFITPSSIYATMYVQVAIDTDSLAMGIALGVLTSLALTGLFECVKQIEDPFVSHVTLDGIDCREELVVLAFQELMVARKMLFPEAEAFAMNQALGKDSGNRSKTTVEKGFGIADRTSRHTVKNVSAMS